MFSFLFSLIIASQLVAPVSELAQIAMEHKSNYPARKMTGSFEPVIEAKSALALDIESGKILYQKDGFKKRPLASITKLMTALVFLENNDHWDRKIRISQDDQKNGGKVVLFPGEEIWLKDLFRTALVGSVNSAAYELASATPLSYEDFIKRMNTKAVEIGMPNYSFRAASGESHTLKNTNKLLTSYLNLVGGKTGYTEEAGFCLANVVSHPKFGQEIVVVILGAESEEERFQQNKFLSQWVFDNWEWGEARKQ